MGAENFVATYATNRNRRNAFGKCVRTKARANVQVKRAALRRALRECKAEFRSDPAAFIATYSGKPGEGGMPGGEARRKAPEGEQGAEPNGPSGEQGNEGRRPRPRVKRRAMRRCVRLKLKESRSEAGDKHDRFVAAAEECLAQLKEAPQAFAEQYGPNKRRAFHKCVSDKMHDDGMHDDDSPGMPADGAPGGEVV